MSQAEAESASSAQKATGRRGGVVLGVDALAKRERRWFTAQQSSAQVVPDGPGQES